MICVIVAITPSFISALMTSTPRSAIRLASSCTVMASGIVTSRVTLTCSCCCIAWRFSRSMRRRMEAMLRTRRPPPSSSDRACVTVILVPCGGRRPRGRAQGPRPGFVATARSCAASLIFSGQRRASEAAARLAGGGFSAARSRFTVRSRARASAGGVRSRSFPVPGCGAILQVRSGATHRASSELRLPCAKPISPRRQCLLGFVLFIFKHGAA